MGSKLSQPGAVFFDDLIWFDLDDIAAGGVAKLEFGRQPDPVFASGVILTAYMRMKLRLQLSGLFAQEMMLDIADRLPQQQRVELVENWGRKQSR